MGTARLIVAGLVCSLASAQTARLWPYPIELSPGFQRAIAAGTRTTTGEPGTRHWTNFARYRLAVEVDPEAKRVAGTAQLTYVNRSPDDLQRLIIHLYHDLLRAGAPRTVHVEPTAGFEIGKVRIGGEELHVSPRDTLLNLRLPSPVARGEELQLEIDYAFDIPRAHAAPRMGYEDDRVFFLGYWYPQFAVYDDVEGWVADPYRGLGEFYMGYADYHVEVTAPVGYLVRATGVLENPRDVLTAKSLAALEEVRRTRDVVPIVDVDDVADGTTTARSDSGKLTWRFHAENVRDVAISLGRTYLWDAAQAVVKDQHGPGRDGTCLIHAVYEANAGDWFRGAEYARHTIEFMSERVYPYPWPHMTVCEGVVSGGMEYPMMTIVGGRRPAGTIAHEVIHMWFPMLVGTNEKRYAWLDEGLTSFWTTLSRSDFTKRANSSKQAVLWAADRIRRGRDVVCMRHADTFASDDFGLASYTKPAGVLHQLRGMLGDDVFFSAFRRYARDWAFKHPYPYDFFHTFSATAGTDLGPYFRMWLFERWQLDHGLASVEFEAGKTVVQIVDHGRAVHPCVVQVTWADGRSARQTVPAATWWTGRHARLTFSGNATEVVLDPDIETLDSNRDNNRWRRDR